MDIVERLRERVRTDVVGLSFPVTYFKDTLCQEAADEIDRLRETIANAAKLNARLMDIIDLAKRMKTAAFNHWCEKTPETNGILVDLQIDFEDALEGLKKDGYFSFRPSTKGERLMDMTRHYHDLYGEESKDQKIKRLYAEIERLREALKDIACDCDHCCNENGLGCDNWTARSALQQKDTE